MIKVIHNTFGDVMRHVANVDTNNLNVAYHLTNTIDKLWPDNDDVEVTTSVKEAAGGARSTSMGDIMVTEHGIVLLVAAFGFDEMNKDNIKRFFKNDGDVDKLEAIIKS